MTSYETVAVLAVMAMWFMVLILVASEAIQAIIRTYRGQVEGELLSMDWEPAVSLERWDLATGGGKDDVRPLREPTELQPATATGGE